MVRRWLVALLTAAVAGAVLVLPAEAHAQEPVRILIYGDSITQGSSGDWTWRYRLWQHFQDAGTPVDLVGPRDGLHNLTTDGGADDHTYASSGWDSDHAAVWGQALGVQRAGDYRIADLVADYSPDVVVGLVGINDLTWLHESPADVEASWREQIAGARATDPGVSVVIVQVPETWDAGVSDYDADLVSLAAELDTPESRVVATSLPALSRDVDTWDGTHPSASGEVKIARSVEDALSSIGVGPPAGMLPVVANGPTRVGTLAAAAGIGQVALSWSPAPGVLAEHLERRDLTRGGAWYRYPYSFGAAVRSWTAGGLTNGHTYEFRLRPAKGTALSEVVTSNVARASPGVPAQVTGLVATSGQHRLSVSWSAAALATSYTVTWWKAGSTVNHRVDVSGRSASIGGLVAGQRYEISVVGVRGTLHGPSSATVAATPTGPRPAAPTLGRLTAGPGARLTVTWAAVRSATSYVVGLRDLTSRTRWRWVRTLPAGTRKATIRRLIRGHRYAVRIRADHQLLSGGISRPARVRIPPRAARG